MVRSDRAATIACRARVPRRRVGLPSRSVEQAPDSAGTDAAVDGGARRIAGHAAARRVRALLRLALAAALATVILPIVAALHGCAGTREYTPPEHALVAIHSTAHGLAAADHIVARRCGVSSPPPECQRFVDAYDLTRGSLIAAERAAEEWRRIGGVEPECRARAAIRGARGDLDALLGLLTSMHVAVPEEVQSAARQLAQMVVGMAGTCGGES
jgi:hypothetical protein